MQDRANRLQLATKQRKKDFSTGFINDTDKDAYLLCDYSQDAFNLGRKDYEPIIRKIAKVAIFVENEIGNAEGNKLGKPQDIEGGIIFKEDQKGKVEPIIYIWQSRDIYYPKSEHKRHEEAERLKHQ